MRTGTSYGNIWRKDAYDPFLPESDAASVGQLIADTYGRFNLAFVSADELASCLAPSVMRCRSSQLTERPSAQVIQAPLVFVAEEDGEIVGVLRGRQERLASLFVRGDRHRHGIGRRLVAQFEQVSIAKGHGVPGRRDALRDPVLHRFRLPEDDRGPQRLELRGAGLRYQPMKKVVR